MRETLKITLIVAILMVCLYFVGYSAVICLKEFTFNEERSLDPWSRMVLNGEVDYTLIKQGSNGYIQAKSDQACSALYYRIWFKLEDYPFLRWKWRVLEFPDISTAVTEEERDDYAARIYVIFPFLSFSASKFLEYVWAEDMPVGTIIDSPYGNNVKIIVARSGSISEGEWFSEDRNLYNDYVKAFGGEPRRKVGAVAIMCDADSTKTSAKSLFDDIIIESLASR